MSEPGNGWAAALTEAAHPSWSRRAGAGRALAPHADVPEAARALAALLLDAEDTAVTRRTAHALTRAGGVAAARLLSVAVTEADDNQADWIRTGVQDALEDRPTGVPALRAACRQLTRSPEEAVRRGAGAILAWTEPTGR